MSRKRPSSRDLQSLAEELGHEDGSDPVKFHDRRRWDDAPPAPGRKSLQLCRQVRDALIGILARSADPVLQDAVVLAVEPAPHAGRLMVTVAGDSSADATHNLARAAGWIRCEVAAVIHRRKVPELVWQVVPTTDDLGIE